ncbi:putative DNA repair protein RAD50 [Trichinella murrelli]|uniref:Putative DNA repair protein RAD50 n=1 Tax=Trichinella murrelli TaxID=144512 RepID=A0A0V0TZ26_9BILA|nr:putative DNA repair protein RAD50 [Trichinella murrelli]
MKKRRSENADDTKQIADDTKQIADDTKQIADDTKQIEDDTKQIEDDTKQIEDDTKQNKRRQSSWDPNSVGLGLGYFERAKLSHSSERDSVEQLENSVPNSHIRRERKETIEQLKILYLPITFGVSEKRLRGKILDEMRSDTPPR